MIHRFCDCATDGYCPRYNRPMYGRFREICQGTNCDLGTAAAFREQWQREAPPSTISSREVGGWQPQSLLLKTDQAPGDAVAMTAAIYSLHKAHPGKYLTWVESPYPEVFQYNPDVVPMQCPADALPIHMHYPAIHKCNERGIHFMQGWCEFMGAALNIHIPLLTNRPHLYFLVMNPPQDDYWVICSGGKNDFTAKQWPYYQEVVDRLHNVVRFVQVGSAVDSHEPLLGAECMVGRTTLRQLFSLVRSARGVLCGVSLLMHVAAALQKPAVVIAGGREPVQWNAYPNQHYLHTVGALPCVSVQGEVGAACWRTRTVPLGDNSVLDTNTCQRPVDGIPECMRLIGPDEVASVVLRYNTSTCAGGGFQAHACPSRRY
jgi:hypothetical protein